MIKTLLTLSTAVALMGPSAADAASRTDNVRTTTTVKSTLRIDAGATGQGPASDDDCRYHAGEISAAFARAANQRRQGDESGARLTEALAVDDMIWLEDSGCFIVY